MARLLWALCALLATLGVASAAVDANTASRSELESISGIGPAIAARIVEERRLAPFRDTADIVRRVKGVGVAKMRKMVAAGLTVGGSGVVITAGGEGSAAARARPLDREPGAPPRDGTRR